MPRPRHERTSETILHSRSGALAGACDRSPLRPCGWSGGTRRRCGHSRCTFRSHHVLRSQVSQHQSPARRPQRDLHRRLPRQRAAERRPRPPRSPQDGCDDRRQCDRLARTDPPRPAHGHRGAAREQDGRRDADRNAEGRAGDRRRHAAEPGRRPRATRARAAARRDRPPRPAARAPVSASRRCRAPSPRTRGTRPRSRSERHAT